MTRICFFMPDLVGGGAERVTLDLARGLVSLGNDVGLVLAHADGALAADERGSSTVPITDLGRARTLAALVPLARHLRRERPEVIVAVLSHAGLVAALARLLARSPARLVVMQHNTMTANVRRSPHARDRLVPLLSRILFGGTTVVCAVSQGVAEDFAEVTGLSRDRIEVVPNPIDYAHIDELSQEPLPTGLAPTLGTRLLVAAGRLVEQKDFATLIHAFSRLPRDCRLLILGEGPQRAALEQLVRDRGLEGRVLLPGFVANPYPVFRAAEVFVLSSLWEGLPTVLLEVLAFDAAIVSTDCRSGPREILAGDLRGTLVPVGDADALATAVARALEDRTPGGRRLDDRAAVRAPYHRDAVVRRFDQLVRRWAA